MLPYTSIYVCGAAIYKQLRMLPYESNYVCGAAIYIGTRVVLRCKCVTSVVSPRKVAVLWICLAHNPPGTGRLNIRHESRGVAAVFFERA